MRHNYFDRWDEDHPNLSKLVEDRFISHQDLADLMNNDLDDFFEVRLKELNQACVSPLGQDPDTLDDLENLVKYIRRERTTKFLWSDSKMEDIEGAL